MTKDLTFFEIFKIGYDLSVRKTNVSTGSNKRIVLISEDLKETWKNIACEYIIMDRPGTKLS